MPLDRSRYTRQPSTLERFEALRPPKKQRETPEEWRDDLEALKDGGVLEFTAPDPKEADTLRRTLARYAASPEYLMKLDYSGSGTTVIVKKSDEPYVKKERRKKQPVEARVS